MDIFAQQVDSARLAFEDAERNVAAAKAAYQNLCAKLAAIEKAKHECVGPVEKLAALLDDEERAVISLRASRAALREAESVLDQARRSHSRAIAVVQHAEIDACAMALAERFEHDYQRLAEEIIAAAGANRSLLGEAADLNRFAPRGIDKLKTRGRLVENDFLSRLRLIKFDNDIGQYFWFPAWEPDVLPVGGNVLGKPSGDSPSWTQTQEILARAETNFTARYVAAAKTIASMLSESRRIVRDTEKFNAQNGCFRLNVKTPCELVSAGKWYDFSEKMIALPSPTDRFGWIWNPAERRGVGDMAD